jgi:ABC-type nickel/cobalt efflux system permease component RcnA
MNHPVVLSVLLGITIMAGTGNVAAGTEHPFAAVGGSLQSSGRDTPAPDSLAAQIARSILAIQTAAELRMRHHLVAVRAGESFLPLLAGLLLAFIYGVIHVLGPGHGKFVVMSFFLSREARWWRGLVMAVQIAVTHVASALVLMAMADVTARVALGGSGDVLRGVKLASYGATALIGLGMLIGVVRRARQAQGPSGAETCCHTHGVAQQGIASVAVGLLPCTGAALIMLYAVANDILWSGIAMVMAIAIGMTVTMTTLGMVAMFARNAFLGRWREHPQGRGRAAVAIECAGALVILGVSLALLVVSL